MPKICAISRFYARTRCEKFSTIWNISSNGSPSLLKIRKHYEQSKYRHRKNHARTIVQKKVCLKTKQLTRQQKSGVSE